MQQHPVPQNITGFEFKLVGFLTIRQFGYVAAAGVISFLIFIIFPGLLRWILITPFAIAGLALAFGNISGLNFDQWLVAFFNAVMKPSQRVWRKEAKTFSFLDPRFAYYLKRPPAVLGEAKDRKKLEAFLSQIDSRNEPNHKLNAMETTKLGTLDFGSIKQLDQVPGSPTTKVGEAVETVEPTYSVRPVQEVVKEQQNG